MKRFPVIYKLSYPWMILLVTMGSCESNQHGTELFTDEILTIGEYMKTNREEYSKFFSVLTEGEMLLPLCGYNPYGEGYTLFLPTDEAVDHFIQQSQVYGDFEELLHDTVFMYMLTRYHTLNKNVNTNEFPFGALTDRTLTGERLTVGFYTHGNNPLYKINNTAPIIKPNVVLSNGYIHVVSEVLQRVDVSGYDWLQQQDGYSILAGAMELSGIRDNLWMSQYTILAEHDSVYLRNGIGRVDDLIDRLAITDTAFKDPGNPLYQFAAYHILYGEFYLNDLYLGDAGYWTLGEEPVVIDVGLDIRINPGIDTFGLIISGAGDTTVIDYIQPVWEACNILTETGPVHSITELLASEPFPGPDQ